MIQAAINLMILLLLVSFMRRFRDLEERIEKLGSLQDWDALMTTRMFGRLK